MNHRVLQICSRGQFTLDQWSRLSPLVTMVVVVECRTWLMAQGYNDQVINFLNVSFVFEMREKWDN